MTSGYSSTVCLISSPSAQTLLVDLIRTRPAQARLLERLGIDSGGEAGRTLADACAEHDLDPQTVARVLDVVEETDDPEWMSVSLPRLLDHIRSTHHEYLRRALPRIEQRLATAEPTPDGGPEGWGERVRAAFLDLKATLATTLEREETYIFPAIRTVAEGRVLPDGSTPEPATLRRVEEDHDETVTSLDRLRALTDDYQPPQGADRSVRDAMSWLHDLEIDLRRHIHKELHIVLPRARSLL